MSDLIHKSRSAFRTSKNISEDSYVFFVDAGRTAQEVKFSFKSFKDGFNTFFKDSAINSINKSHFEILVSVPEGTAEAVKSKLGYLPSDIKVTLVEDKDRYAALSASDFGMLHNG